MTPVATATDPAAWDDGARGIAATGVPAPRHGADPQPADWVDAAELVHDPGPFVARLRSELGAPSAAIAASMLARQLTPLVVSPVVAALSTRQLGLDLGVANLRVGFDGAAVEVVTGTRPRIVEGSLPALLDWAAHEVIDGVLGTLITSLRQLAPLGGRHLWGNVALAVHAPVAALLATSGHDGRPMRDGLLERLPQLQSLVEVLPVTGTNGAELEAVRRRTCCLLYRLPPPVGGYCGTCSLHPADEHRQQLVSYYRDLHRRHTEEEGAAPRASLSDGAG